jgi:hypothetical protein
VLAFCVALLVVGWRERELYDDFLCFGGKHESQKSQNAHWQKSQFFNNKQQARKL